jgi:large subunit ribosomal protein L1
MDDSQLASNASAVIAAIEKKLPQGDKNISNALIKFSMGKAVRLRSLKEKKER